MESQRCDAPAGVENNAQADPRLDVLGRHAREHGPEQRVGGHPRVPGQDRGTVPRRRPVLSNGRRCALRMVRYVPTRGNDSARDICACSACQAGGRSNENQWVRSLARRVIHPRSQRRCLDKARFSGPRRFDAAAPLGNPTGPPCRIFQRARARIQRLDARWNARNGLPTAHPPGRPADRYVALTPQYRDRLSMGSGIAHSQWPAR